MIKREPLRDIDDEDSHQESPLVVYDVDSPDTTDSTNTDDVNITQQVPSVVSQSDNDNSTVTDTVSHQHVTQSTVPSTASHPDVTHSVKPDVSQPDVTQSVCYSIINSPDLTQSKALSMVPVSHSNMVQSVIQIPSDLIQPDVTQSVIPSTVLSHSTSIVAATDQPQVPSVRETSSSARYPFIIMDKIDMPRQGTPMILTRQSTPMIMPRQSTPMIIPRESTPMVMPSELVTVKVSPDENLYANPDSCPEYKGHSTTCLTCRDGVHLKRPMFEKCVRRFRSKLYEIAGISEDRNTPILPTYKLRLWKDSLCNMIGSCDTRKLNDCYKHDMKTARSPLPLWREIDKLFQRWEKKLVLGQVRDTLKQTQFKIINAVQEAQRLQLLTDLNQSKISFPVFLERCREETVRQNQSSLPLDVEDITCNSVSDGEDEITCTASKTHVHSSSDPKHSPPQLSGQIEDLLRKVKDLERKWQNAERRALDSENKSLTVYNNLQELTQKLNRKEEELTSSRHSADEHRGLLEQTIKLKSAQLTAKQKEIEFLIAKSSERIKLAEAELALKCALLSAKERELELFEIKRDLDIKEMKRRLYEKDKLIAQKDEELSYYSQPQTRQESRELATVPQTVPSNYQPNRAHLQISSSSQIHDGHSSKRRPDSEVIHMPMKRIKQEPEYL